MKALVWTDTKRIGIYEIPFPRRDPNGVMVEVKAVGICGSEVEAYLGRSRKRVPPLVMGHELAGVVHSAGPEVRDVSVGDRVVVQPLFSCHDCPECRAGKPNICRNRKLMSIELAGAYAQFVDVPAGALFRLPESVSFEVGTFAEPLANAVHILGRVDGEGCRRLMVVGGGTIGALVAMLARAIGVGNVAVAEPNQRRRETLALLGPGWVIDPAEPTALPRALEWSDGGADVVVDASGAAGARKFAIECAAPGATVVFVGQGSGANDADERDIVTKELIIMGSYAYTDADFSCAIELLSSRRVDPSRMMRVIPLEDGPRAFAELAEADAADIKVVMIP